MAQSGTFGLRLFIFTGGNFMEITESLIPNGRVPRPGAENSMKYITIHDTANDKKGANAKAHANYLRASEERTSWHYTVDDSSIYRHIPDCEKSYHTSNRSANETSIAIELCVNRDGDFEKTKENAIRLVRSLRKKYGIPPENIVCHRDWTGKKCPARLIDDGLDDFLAACRKEDEEREKFISVSELVEMGYLGIKF